MQIDDYQHNAGRTLGDADLRILALGLCGEAGEAAEHIKKHFGHGHDLDVDDLAKELGDVLWYVAALATALDVNLSQVAQANVAKLRARYPDGFSEERSRNRGGRNG
jgi:NTP pyrophosphatase (non-canonical NTP hydrolase)